MELGISFAATTSPDVIGSAARDAEARGYGSFWVTHPPGADGLAALAAAARVTSTIDLGVGVVPLHLRDPASILAGLREHDLPPDRLLLGLGSQPPGSLERMRAGLSELRTQLECRLVVGGLAPRMCRLAGELADGVLFNWLTPGHARVSAGWVLEGAEAAGRPAPATYAYVRLALGADARARLEGEAAVYAGASSYRAHFERMGIEPVEPAIAESTAVTAIAASDARDVVAQLARWEGVVDSVVFRALPAANTLAAHLDLVRAGAPEAGRWS